VDEDLPEFDMFHDAPHYFAVARICAAAIPEEEPRSEMVSAAAWQEERIALLAGLRKTPHQ
jgi:hypothetical protein